MPEENTPSLTLTNRKLFSPYQSGIGTTIQTLARQTQNGKEESDSTTEHKMKLYGRKDIFHPSSDNKWRVRPRCSLEGIPIFILVKYGFPFPRSTYVDKPGLTILTGGLDFFIAVRHRNC